MGRADGRRNERRNQAPAPQDGMRAIVEADRRKRDIVVQALNQMPGVSCVEPEGTIYAFPDITGTGFNSQDLAMRILKEAHVVVESGAFYGPGGEYHCLECRKQQYLLKIEKYYLFLLLLR